MRLSIVALLLSFIVAVSYAANINEDPFESFAQDLLNEPYEQDLDEPHEQDLNEEHEMDESEKREVCRDKTNCAGYAQYCSQSPSVRKYCPKTCNTCSKVISQCRDKTSQCPGWKSYCDRNSWVKNNCKKTCGQCNNPPKPKPRPTARPQIPQCDPNKVETGGCVQWKSMNYCDRSSRYFNFMKKTCPGTCGLCRGYKPPTQAPPHTTSVNIAECLAAHNDYRRRHGAPPLKWDSKMADMAKDYALKLAKMKKMEHDNSIGGKYGENLASSYHSGGTQKYTCKDATKAWYDEIKDYSFSNPGFSGKTGHFTQVVWKSSSLLGVGIARNGGHTYVVARYSPPGNFRGQFAQNVGGPLN